MQDRVGSIDLANGAIRYVGYNAYKVVLRGVWLKLEDEPLQIETPLTAGNLLTAQTATKIWLAGDAPVDPMIDEALAKLSEPSYRVGDILTTVRVLSAPWHACDGSTFSRTAYPALYAVLGGTTLPSISYSSDTTTYIKMADD